jgi:ABC-type Fe3+-hydroxamate transport system substrate-binding protein
VNKKHVIGYGTTALIALLVGTGIGSSSGQATDQQSTTSATPAATVTVAGSVPGPTVTVTAGSVKTVTSEPQVGVAMEGDGTYEVGVDVRPGTYVSSKPDSGTCYWARLKGTDGIGGIIDNDLSSGRTVVTIKKSDKFFETKGCSDWTKR